LTLASVFSTGASQFEIYDQAFHIFWRDPQLLERVMAMFLPQVYGRQGRERTSASSRVPRRCTRSRRKPQETPVEPPQETQLDASLSFSSRRSAAARGLET